MRAPLEEIYIFNKCPRLWSLSTKFSLFSTDPIARLFHKIVSKAYYQANTTGHKLSWKLIIFLYNKCIFQGISPDGEDEIEKLKKKFEPLLAALNTWYNSYYLSEDDTGFMNLPLEGEIKEHVITGTAPSLIVREPLTLLWVESSSFFEAADPGEVRNFEILNDLRPRGLLWLLSKNLDEKVFDLDYYLIGPWGTLRRIRLRVGEVDNLRAEETIYEMAYSMARRISYPSRTNICKVCKFRKKCWL